jgi:hypothetical protein
MPIDSEVATFARTASMTYTPNELIVSEAVAEVNDKQGWEIRDIIGKEDVDGVPHF